MSVLTISLSTAVQMANTAATEYLNETKTHCVICFVVVGAVMRYDFVNSANQLLCPFSEIFVDIHNYNTLNPHHLGYTKFI